MTQTGHDVSNPRARGPVWQVLRVLGRTELFITVTAFCSVVALVSVQVIFRYTFDIGLVWVQEVAQLLILIAYFFGTSFVFKSRQYLLISFLFDRFPEGWKLPLYVFAQLLTAAFCTVLFVELIRIAPGQLYMKTYILHIPRFYSSLPLLIASMSMAITALYYAWVSIGAAARLEHDSGLDAIEAAMDLFPEHRPRTYE